MSQKSDELIWSAKGDPEPEQTEEENKVAKRFNSLMTLILRKFAESYPSLYDPSIYNSKTIELNTSHKEVFSALSNAAAREDDKTFSDIALPTLLDVLVMQPLV